MTRALLVLLLLTACSVGDPDASKGVDVTVRVVYTDRDTINEKARMYGLTEQANGFYHRLSNTLWCPDEESESAFRTCGHELRHVVKGSFHK